MRAYAMTLTGVSTMLIAAYVLVEYTQAEFFEMVFLDLMVGLFSMLVFALVTEPRKKKAHWEQADGLDVMIMETRKR